MVPRLTEGGRSFKGAALYYLHDKRRTGEAERLTSDRVAWTDILNLPTADPERAWRMMADTALSQAELKAAAGIKATGRKLTTPVFAYSLSWHETDRPDRAEMLKAAHETLAALDLKDRQAIIVCHNDTAHPHLHVLVNRVDPQTGKAAVLSKSKEKLQAWALRYQEQRGQGHCPARARNATEREERRQRPPLDGRPAAAFDRAARQSAISSAVAQLKQETAARRQAMVQARQAAGQRRDVEFRQLAEDRKAARQAVFERYAPAFAALWKPQPAHTRPEPDRTEARQVVEQLNVERQAFEQAEGSVLGRIRNARALATGQGWAATLRLATSQVERRRLFERQQTEAMRARARQAAVIHAAQDQATPLPRQVRSDQLKAQRTAELQRHDTETDVLFRDLKRRHIAERETERQAHETQRRADAAAWKTLRETYGRADRPRHSFNRTAGDADTRRGSPDAQDHVQAGQGDLPQERASNTSQAFQRSLEGAAGGVAREPTSEQDNRQKIVERRLRTRSRRREGPEHER